MAIHPLYTEATKDASHARKMWGITHAMAPGSTTTWYTGKRRALQAAMAMREHHAVALTWRFADDCETRDGMVFCEGQYIGPQG